MAAKIVLAFCAQALIAQCVLSQCLGRAPLVGPGIINPGIGPYGFEGLAVPGCGGVSSTGGGFIVNSVSPIAPTGLTIISENAIEGPLVVGGNLPFLATVALEGILPTAGFGAVSYGCGDGAIGIVSEAPIATGIVGPGTYPPAGPGYAPATGVYGPGLIGAPYGINGINGVNGINNINGIGCGCGGIY